MTIKRKLLFVFQSKSSFIERDLEMLKKHYEVKTFNFDLKKKYWKLPILLMKLFFNIKWADITYSWFAEIHSYWSVILCKKLKKKSIVVIGGYEVAKISKFKYGAMLNPKLAKRVKYIIKNANKIIAVSNFSKEEISKYIKNKEITTIYNGIDTKKYKPSGQKENLILTVTIITKKRIKIKGLNTFIEVARYFPDFDFLIIGNSLDNSIHEIKQKAPKNVKIKKFVTENNLIKYYQRAKIYCQLSYYESFGIALAEAMACECIPISTNNGALPEVIGKTGYLVPYNDIQNTVDAIKKVLKKKNGTEARKRIIDNFSLKKREKILVDFIDNI